MSELAALKQDAKNFKWRQMANEREKRAKLEPLYLIARALLPKLAVSQRNLHHYASLANFYTVYDLRRLKTEQTHLYLLCYAWQRYRQFTDNLVDALSYHMKQLEDESKARTDKRFVAEQAQREQETPRVGRLLLLYVDDTVTDITPFGDVRQHAFKIMPREALQIAGQRLSEKPASRFRQRSRHSALFGCTRCGYRAAARKAGRIDGLHRVRLDGRFGTERAHRSGLPQVPLSRLRQAIQ